MNESLERQIKELILNIEMIPPNGCFVHKKANMLGALQLAAKVCHKNPEKVQAVYDKISAWYYHGLANKHWTEDGDDFLSILNELTTSGMAGATTTKNFPQFIVPLGASSPGVTTSTDFYDMLKKSGKKKFDPKKNKKFKTPMVRWDDFMRAAPRSSVWYRLGSDD